MLKVIELFAGAGGASFALKDAGIEHTILAYSEIDKYASAFWEKHHSSTFGNLGDIKTINFKVFRPLNSNDQLLITGGSPCQDFSIVGHRRGTHNDDGSLTRSGLVYEYLRAIKDANPTQFIFENVGGSLSAKNKDGQLIIPLLEQSFKELGYKVHTKVVKGTDYGIPQLRPRVVIVGVRSDIDTSFSFPVAAIGLKYGFNDVIERDVDKRYNLTDKQILDVARRAAEYTGYNIDLTAPIETQIDQLVYELTLRDKGSNGPWVCYSCWSNYVNSTIASTLITSCVNTVGIGGRIHVNLETKQLRKITPREAFSLMDMHNVNLDGFSNTQLYKIAGNAWCIAPFAAIMEELYNV